MTPSVLLVGAGPIGLTLAAMLRQRDIEVLVLEAHPGLSRHPKARGISARSMEAFRALGVEERIREVALPASHIRFFRGDTLADPHAEVSAAPPTHDSGNTPSPGVLCSQDVLEPVLLEHAKSLGTQVLFGHRVTDVQQTETGVSVTAQVAGETKHFDAAYVIGCDGARSTVREAAGIALEGEQGLARFLSIRLIADLRETVRGRESTSYFLAGGKGGFLAVDNATRWIYQYPIAEHTDSDTLRADNDRLAELVRVAAGVSELEVTVLDTMTWRMDACLATTFRNGRLLLAGDAAHQTPPTGGHGMNVGIGDAETLAWRLAAVLGGSAPAATLDRYTAERRPVAETIIAVSSGNAGRNYAIDDELLLATHYGAAEPVALGPYAPSGEPGRRIPHVAIEGDPAVVSSLDLVAVHHLPTLVSEHRELQYAAAAAALGIPYAALTEASRRERDPGEFREKTGLALGGALLVRPDGHIAERLASADDLASAFEWLMGRA
ncbi:FAD-dependent monooxygenase [Leucobacter chinensis]|uniref:FAD-dependent monooxygenase n=1 Tax=Leucobacter chinensis TaxID=2851010 RepID=UPI001C24637D|nr:FAD-dependent monooxygenase [Leucobacter chinensis]